jgi:hypothetical protein
MGENSAYGKCLEALSEVITSAMDKYETLQEAKLRASSLMLTSFRKTESAMNRLQGGSDGDGGATIADYSLEELCV